MKKIELNESRFFKYFLISSLYFSFGLNAVFFSLILPLYLLDVKISPELITILIGIMALPMYIKFVWGGIIDYFIRFGRKPFIVYGGLLNVVSLIILFFINPGDALIPFIIIDLTSWVGIAFLTLSLDALVISSTVEKERGKINGVMYAAQNVGLAGGALFLPFIAKTLGYNMVFLVTGFIILPIVLIPLILKEKLIVKKRQKFSAVLIQEFKKKHIIVMSIFAILVMMSSGIILLIAPIWMNLDLHLDITQIGFITMLFTIAIAIGSIFGGVLADKFGRKTTLYLLILCSVLFTALLIFSDSWEYFALIYCVVGFLQGGYTAPICAMFMDVTNPRIGAAQYSIFISLFNFGIMIGMTISGSLYVILGISRVFLYSAWVFGPVLLILYFIRLKKT